MTDESEPDDFFRVEGKTGPDGEPLVLSRSAYLLHTGAVVSSWNGRFGFVSDDHLNALSAATTTAAAELCLVGLWERADTDDGYEILDEEMLATVRAQQERMALASAHCAVDGHEVLDDEPTWCGRCGAPLDGT
jgi:hypothetical protein